MKGLRIWLKRHRSNKFESHNAILYEDKPFMPLARRLPFDPRVFFAPSTLARMAADYPKGRLIFSRGDSAKTLFYIRKGGVKLAVVSKRGKEAVVAILGAGEFFGESCVAGQPFRMTTAIAITPCSLLRIGKSEIRRLLPKEQKFANCFILFLVLRILKFQDDLANQLFNPCEKRLARALLMLSRYGNKGKPEAVLSNVNQHTLARMIGTTRGRVSLFMNKFRRLGFIDYRPKSSLRVRRSLLKMVSTG